MTQALLASVLPAAPQAGPARAGNAKGDAAAGPGEFADCMQQARGAAAPEAAPVEAEDQAPAPTTTAEATAASTAEAPTATDLAALLPGWGTPPPAVAASTAAATASDAGEADAVPALASSAAALPAALPRTTAARADSAVSTAPAAVSTPAAGAGAEPAAPALSPATAAVQAQGEARPAAPETAATATALPMPAAPSLHAATPRAAETALPFSAQLAAAIDTPAFAPALAAQVRWWAQDGVQQAQLTLNPPEMGPVAVKIVVLDGREARIDFSADLAATRNAIESALPVLAAALDDSGLKLSGGGVHDGAAQRQLPWQAQGTPSRGAPGREGEHSFTDATGTRPAGPGRGLVDLVA